MGIIASAEMRRGALRGRKSSREQEGIQRVERKDILKDSRRVGVLGSFTKHSVTSSAWLEQARMDLDCLSLPYRIIK